MAAKKLTAKQQRFVEEYLIDLNATQAAIRAGYSKKTSYAIGIENLKKPEIMQAVMEAKIKRSERTEIDADWVLTSAVRVFEKCMQDVAVTDNEGCPTGEYKFEPAGANKALETIGRHVSVQAFLDKKEVKHSLTDELAERMDSYRSKKRDGSNATRH